MENLHFLHKDRLGAFEGNREPADRRTVIRPVDPASLSEDLISELDAYASAFGLQVNDFLKLLKTRRERRLCVGNCYRQLRTRLRAEHKERLSGIPKAERKNYPLSPYGLQGKSWKAALEKAAEIVAGYWREAQSRALKALYLKKFYGQLKDAEKRYAKSLLSRLSFDFFDMLDGRTAPHAWVGTVRKPRWLCRKIRSLINKKCGAFPTWQKNRTIVLDEDSYRVKKVDGRQVLSVMSMIPRKRMDLTLKGACSVRKTIMIVRKEKGYDVHVSLPLKTKKLKNIPETPDKRFYFATAFDMGWTEVMTSDQGVPFGTGLGEAMMKFGLWMDKKLPQRNRVMDIYKKTTDPVKRANMRRCNLGRRTWEEGKRRYEERLNNIINHSINDMMDRHPSDVFVVEAFSDHFKMDGLSKKTRRKLSLWVRGAIAERLEFKTAERHVKLLYVPASYSSQRCPVCGYVHKANRSGDKFLCRHCGHKAHADTNAAINLLYAARHPDMHGFMKKEAVKAVYEKEFKKMTETRTQAA